MYNIMIVLFSSGASTVVHCTWPLCCAAGYFAAGSKRGFLVPCDQRLRVRSGHYQLAMAQGFSYQEILVKQFKKKHAGQLESE